MSDGAPSAVALPHVGPDGICTHGIDLKPRDHEWISASGRPWSLRVKSDLCAMCGSTPDVHPPDAPPWPEDAQ